MKSDESPSGGELSNRSSRGDGLPEAHIQAGPFAVDHAQVASTREWRAAIPLTAFTTNLLPT